MKIAHEAFVSLDWNELAHFQSQRTGKTIFASMVIFKREARN